MVNSQPAGWSRLRIALTPAAGPSWRKTALVGAATALLAVAAVSVLTAGSGVRHAALQQAKPFTISQVGDPARSISLADFRGKPVIINFFASWCEICREETPLLARFYRAHDGRVLIIGVDGNDTTTAALKFLHAHGVTYPVGADPALHLTFAYGVGAGFPQTIFLDARHQILRHIYGAVTAGELNSWASSVLRPGTGVG
jgi:cytochrome c biogenesis protein CcmG, thiol:disulfide interchange protein DsbE